MNQFLTKSPFRTGAIIRWILIAAGICLTGLVLYKNTATLVLLAISLFLAYLLDPLVNRLQWLKFSRTMTVIVLIACFIACFSLLLLILVPQISQQASDLIDKQTNLVTWFDDNLKPLLNELELDIQNDELDYYITQTTDWLKENYPSIIRPLSQAIQAMFTGVSSFIIGLLHLVFVPVFTFYLLRDFDKIRRAFYKSIPPSWHAPIDDWLSELDQVVGGFLRGQFSIAVILALIYAIGLSVLGVPLGAILGIVAGLANMVPYTSAVVGLLPALLLSFVDNHDVWRLLWIVLLFSGGQLLEGLYLSPRIMGKEVGLHPVLIMVSIIAGGTLLGLVGIILAVPSAAILKVVFVRWHKAWTKRWPNGQVEQPNSG